jgi:hypothetical protein
VVDDRECRNFVAICCSLAEVAGECCSSTEVAGWC